jgi:hypothetical protein
LIGHQAPLDQCLAGLVARCAGQGQALAEGRVGIVAEAPGVSHSHQKEIERTGLMAEVVNRVLTDQALIHPAELLGDGAESGERDGAFVHRACLLRGRVHS